MNNSHLTVFSFQGNEVRTVTESNEVFFVAKDVCDCLDIRTDTVRVLLEEDEVIEINPNTIGVQGGRSPLAVSEAGLYSLVLRSRKPEAKNFKRWVTHEVLPSIRRDGGYIAAKPDESLEELSLRTINALNAALERQKKQIAAQGEQLKLQAPDVEYCRTCLASSSLMTVNTIAAHLGVSAKRLNAFLDGEGWIYRQGRNWCPSAKIRNCGYCDYETVPYVNREGADCTSYNLKWTEPGRRAVIDLWNKRHNSNISAE